MNAITLLDRAPAHDDDRADELALADRWRARPSPTLSRLARAAVRLVERYHPAHFEGVENIPAGPALLVGNHGLLGYEAMFFFAGVFDRTRRAPVGLADRWFFRLPLVRDVLVRVGGAYGHARNAHRLLGQGQLVVCYPGGARECFKHTPADRYRLLWARSRGFARVALECGVPIVPFAAAGVDDTFDIEGRHDGFGRWWMGHDKYDVPRLRGRGGWLVPKRVPFLFRFGAPITLSDAPTPRPDPVDVHRGHFAVWRKAQGLVDDTVREWRARFGAAR